MGSSTRHTLENINNPVFRSYAERYRLNEERLYAAIREQGLELGPDRTDETADLRSKLTDLGVVSCNGGRSLHLNRLSPACTHCYTAEGATTFILTLACNRTCYFCTNRNQYNYDELSRTTNDVVGQFDQFVQSAGTLRSVALTGGEPLLYPDRCLEFYRHVKEHEHNIHTRLYSNGDLVDDDLLKPLASCLDEIRIGVKTDDQGNFDLDQVEKTLECCKKHIRQVTVEMPVEPGSFLQMKPLLDLLNRLEIFSLNLLEYLFPWQHAEDYVKRGIKIKHRPYVVHYNYNYAGGLPVDGSESEALRCLHYAAENQFKIGVHYCSLENKLTSQIYQQNKSVKPAPTEIKSQDDHFFKSIKLFDRDAEQALIILQSAAVDRYDYDERQKILEMHPHDIQLLSNSPVSEAALVYAVVEEDGCQCFVREIYLKKISPHQFTDESIKELL